MNVLLLTDGIYPYMIGGMQKHSYNLCKSLLSQGVNITLVNCVNYEDTIPSNLEANKKINGIENESLTVITLRFPKPTKLPGHYIRNSYKYSERVFNLIKDKLQDYDFVYAKGFTAWKLLEEKQKELKCPFVGVKFHGYEMYQPIVGITNKMKQILFRKSVKWNNLNADYVFSYGGKITELIASLGVQKDKIIEIPTGIDENWIRKTALTTNKRIKFLFLGRYERRKGIEEINACIQKLKDIDAEFHFIGPIPETKQIRVKNVIYYGKIMEARSIQKIMDTCDVLLCPSYSEGMPNVILEGMSRGLAIIATDVGAVSQMVSSQNGWLVKKGNEFVLKNVILEAIADTALIDKKKKSIQKVKNQFLWSLIGGKIIAEIKKTIGG